MELQLEELEAAASEDEAAAETARAQDDAVPAPAACPCCGGKLAKLGEDVTETLEVVPRRWKVSQTVRERFACRVCESVTQPPAPFHPIARGRAGPELLTMILEAMFGQHLPLNRQSEAYAREGVALDVSTLTDWVGPAPRHSRR